MAIAFAIGPATFALQVWTETFAAFADPADLSGGHTCHQGIGLHVLGHHSSSSDKGTLAYRMAADDSAIGTQRGTFANPGFGIHAMHGKMRTRRGHIGEHTAWTAEHIVLNLNAFIDGDVVLHPYTITNLHIIAHIHILAERAVLSNDSTLLDMAEMPNLRAFADAHIFIDITAFVYEIFAHLFFLIPSRRPAHQQYGSP